MPKAGFWRSTPGKNTPATAARWGLVRPAKRLGVPDEFARFGRRLEQFPAAGLNPPQGVEPARSPGRGVWRPPARQTRHGGSGGPLPEMLLIAAFPRAGAVDLH